MIEALKIQHPNIESCELTKLQRVNVICGKNSSGKSTLVKSILDSPLANSGKKAPEYKSLPGRVLSAELLTTSLVESFPTLAEDPLATLLNEFSYKLLLGKDIWYYDEQKQLDEKFDSLIPQYQAVQQVTVANTVNAIIKQLFTFSPLKIIEIPLNRAVTFKGSVSNNLAFDPAGSQLVAHVSMMMHQLPGDQLSTQLEKFRHALYFITDGIEFAMQAHQTNNQSITLHFSGRNKNWIKGDDWGRGLQDVMSILYNVLIGDAHVYLVEEPESHLHPDLQRRLLAYLKEYTTKQFFFTTHSNVFLDDTYVDRVFLTSITDKIRVSDATSKASVLNELGYTIADNLVSDLVILVEGLHDKPIIEEFLVKMDLFENYNIKIWFLGGNNMNQVDLTVFTQNYHLIALVDQDPESASVREEFVKICNDYNIPVHRLSRYAIENYFTIGALREVFKGSNTPNVTITEINPNIKLKKQLGFDIKNYNRAIVRAMTLQDIEGTDLFEFFEDVRGILEGTSKLSDKIIR